MKFFRLSLTIILAAVIVAGCLPNPMMESGKIALKEHDFDRALRNLDSLVVQNPNNAEAWFLKGFTHEKLGQLEEMSTAFRKSTSLGDMYKGQIQDIINDYIARYSERFNTAVDSSRWEYALALIDTMIIIDPSDPVLYHQGAIAAYNGDLFDVSLDYANREIEIETGEPNIKVRRLILSIHTLRKETDEMIKWGNVILPMIDVRDKDGRDDYMRAVDALVTAYEAKEMKAESEAIIADALSKFPDNILLKQNLATMMMRRDDVEGALSIMKEIIERAPDNMYANKALGIMLIDKDNYDEGVPYLLVVIEKEPNDIKALQGLTRAYFNTDQGAKAKEMMARLKQAQEEQSQEKK